MSAAGGAGPDAAAPGVGEQKLRLVTANSGIFLAMTYDDERDAAARWRTLASMGSALAARDALPGFDARTMEIAPMRANPAWGLDAGPHFSVVSVVGVGTADCDGTPDPSVEDATGATGRALDPALRARADSLADRRYSLDLSVDPTLTYLFGSAANDAVTNGPVMVTLAHESARALMNDVRGELGLKPFPLTHSVHTTLCKVTGRGGDHAALRARLGRWPPEGRFFKKLTDLSEALGAAPDAAHDGKDDEKAPAEPSA